jgi:hypothetical protein
MTVPIRCAYPGCNLQVSPENWELHKATHKLEEDLVQLDDEGVLVAHHLVKGSLKRIEEYR